MFLPMLPTAHDTYLVQVRSIFHCHKNALSLGILFDFISLCVRADFAHRAKVTPSISPFHRPTEERDSETFALRATSNITGIYDMIMIVPI